MAGVTPTIREAALLRPRGEPTILTEVQRQHMAAHMTALPPWDEMILLVLNHLLAALTTESEN
jgi:hypothetical protein